MDEISEALLEYKERGGEIDLRWYNRDLPEEIAIHLDQERIAEWIGAFDSRNDAGRHFWDGLIRPAFDWAFAMLLPSKPRHSGAMLILIREVGLGEVLA